MEIEDCTVHIQKSVVDKLHEECNSGLRFARKKAVLDVLERIIGATMDLKTAGDRELFIPVAGGQYLLTGRDRFVPDGAPRL